MFLLLAGCYLYVLTFNFLKDKFENVLCKYRVYFFKGNTRASQRPMEESKARVRKILEDSKKDDEDSITTLDKPENWYKFLEMFDKFDKYHMPYVFVSGKNCVGKSYLSEALMKRHGYSPVDVPSVMFGIDADPTVFSDPEHPKRELLIRVVHHNMVLFRQKATPMIFEGNVKEKALRNILFPSNEFIRVCVVPDSLEHYKRAIWDTYLTDITRDRMMSIPFLYPKIRENKEYPLGENTMEEIAKEQISTMKEFVDEYCEDFYIVVNDFKEENEW